MDPRQDRVARLARLVLLASTSFGFAAGAHVVGGGVLPSGLGLLVVLAVTLAATSVAARFRARTWWLVPFLAGLHAVLHHGFMLLAPGAHGTATAHAGHHALDARALAEAAAHGTTAVADVAHAGHGLGAGMLAAHAAAVVVTAVLLSAGERAGRLAHTVWTWLLPAVAGVFRPAPPARTAPVPAAAPALPRWVLLTAVAPRRGPPVPAAALA